MGLRRIVIGVAVIGVLLAWASHAYATALGNSVFGSTGQPRQATVVVSAVADGSSGV